MGGIWPYVKPDPHYELLNGQVSFPCSQRSDDLHLHFEEYKRRKISSFAWLAEPEPAFETDSPARLRSELRRGILRPHYVTGEGWCAVQVSNLRPLPCEGNALPLS